MRTWVIGILVLLAWTAGSSYWYVCKIKGLCPDGSSAVSGFAGMDSSRDSLRELPSRPSGSSISASGSDTSTSDNSTTMDTAVKDSATIHTPDPIVNEDDGPLPPQLAKPYTVLFVFAGPQASGRGELAHYLDELAAYLKAHSGRKAILKGYTDDTAARENNLKLAQRRCDAIAELLLSRGVSSDQMVTEALGEADPVATNDTPEGRRLNRRVVISIQEFP